MLVYLLAAVIVVVAALLAFGVAALLHLQGMTYILFVAILLVLGIAAAVVIIVLHLRAAKQQAADGLLPDGGAGGDLDLLLEDANRKLRASQQGAKSLDAIPLLYILGDAGAAKTTQVLRSGLDPELVAGAVPQAGETLPTAVLNLWFTRQAALVEVGEAIRQNMGLLTRLVVRTRAKAYKSAFGPGQAPRGAVVCLSAELLTAADGGASLMASARTTGIQLREISRVLGSPLPVYVFITKLDRVPYFEQYVRNLSNVEVAQVFGSPLARTDISAGVYADHAARTLTTALDGICYQLGEFRVEMLERENDARNVGGVYEFPREFGKLRKNLNQYLVELCKPSQLSANPYLRGFYFTGIRAQIIERAAAAPATVEQRAPQDAGATQYLNLSLGKTPGGNAPQPPQMVAQRVPQWTFLPRLFPEVVLNDKAALTASKQTAPARLFRRILYATIAILLAAYGLLLLVSFIHNAGIEHRIENAARALPPTGPGSISLPSLSDLKNLEEIRQAIVQLDAFNQGQAHWSYRWGLYQGEALADRARKVYFDRFRPAMLNPAQANFLTYMRGLPDQPATNSDFSLYTAAYNPLKAYLITTTNPEKSSSFLTPVFLQYWIGSRQVDSDSQQLAQKQIDFYASELLRKPPYVIDADKPAVTHDRAYLNYFLAETRMYQAMLNDADKANPGIDFNRLYPAAGPCVTDPHIVHGAFTKPGFAFMQKATDDPGKYASGEKWVLGDSSGSTQGGNISSADLKTHYYSDYMQEWHLFMTAARVNCAAGLREMPDRLAQLTGPASPLLLLFSTVSRNTAVPNDAIKTAFQPTQVLVDPNATDQYIGGANKPYIDALLALSGAISQIPPQSIADPAAFTPVQGAITSANAAVSIASQQFKVETQYNTANTVQTLMKQPIDCVARFIPSAGAPGAGGGKKICDTVTALLGKYPFAAPTAVPASVADVNAVFAPNTGAVWTIYNATLKPFIVPVGAQYDKSPTAPATVNPRYLAYFNRLAHISNALYPNGAASPAFDFNLRIKTQNGVTNATFVVDGQRIPNGSISQKFHWDGATAQKASLVAGTIEVPFPGPWGLFQLVHAANKITRTATGYQLDYTLENNSNVMLAGHSVAQSGSAGSVSFELSGPGAEILMPEFFAGLQCPGPAVK